MQFLLRGFVVSANLSAILCKTSTTTAQPNIKILARKIPYLSIYLSIYISIYIYICIYIYIYTCIEREICGNSTNHASSSNNEYNNNNNNNNNQNTSLKPLTHISFGCEVPTPSIVEGQHAVIFAPRTLIIIIIIIITIIIIIMMIIIMIILYYIIS